MRYVWCHPASGSATTTPPPAVWLVYQTCRCTACHGRHRQVPTAILPLRPGMLTTCVLKYAHQLKHPNPLTQASGGWGLMCALWRFSTDMPCVLRGLADCDYRRADHDRFLWYTWLMHIPVWAVLESHHAEVPQHPLGVAGTVSEADGAQATLAAGYRDRACIRRAGWSSRFRGPETLPSWPRHVQWAQEQILEGVALRDIPDEALFVQDASSVPPPRDTAGRSVRCHTVTGRGRTPA